ncbi:MAG: hypothetical protein AB4206_03655 [Xenococcaceae cyanobacterium]
MRKFNSTIIAFATLTALGSMSQQAVAGESYVRNSDTRSFSETRTNLTMNSTDWSYGSRDWSNWAEKIYIDGSFEKTYETRGAFDVNLTGGIKNGYFDGYQDASTSTLNATAQPQRVTGIASGNANLDVNGNASGSIFTSGNVQPVGVNFSTSTVTRNTSYNGQHDHQSVRTSGGENVNNIVPNADLVVVDHSGTQRVLGANGSNLPAGKTLDIDETRTSNNGNHSHTYSDQFATSGRTNSFTVSTNGNANLGVTGTARGPVNLGVTGETTPGNISGTVENPETRVSGAIGGDIHLGGGGSFGSKTTVNEKFNQFTVHLAGSQETGWEKFGNDTTVGGTIFTYSTENTTAHESAAGNR